MEYSERGGIEEAMAQTFVDRIVEQLASSLRDRVGTLMSELERDARGRMGRGAAAQTGRRRRKLDMRCRVAGCRQMSRGPRFGFICDDHRKKLSKREQAAAREAWNAKAA
jgi:hypothetical protein